MINKYSVQKAAKAIKKTRKDMGKEFSQDKMATLLGLKNRQSYANIENGTSLPSWEQLLTICNIFECDITYLVGEHESKRRKVEDIREAIGLTESAVEEIISLSDYQKETLCCLLNSGLMRQYLEELFSGYFLKKRLENEDSTELGDSRYYYSSEIGNIHISFKELMQIKESGIQKISTNMHNDYLSQEHPVGMKKVKEFKDKLNEENSYLYERMQGMIRENKIKGKFEIKENTSNDE